MDQKFDQATARLSNRCEWYQKFWAIIGNDIRLLRIPCKHFSHGRLLRKDSAEGDKVKGSMVHLPTGSKQSYNLCNFANETLG